VAEAGRCSSWQTPGVDEAHPLVQVPALLGGLEAGAGDAAALQPVEQRAQQPAPHPVALPIGPHPHHPDVGERAVVDGPDHAHERARLLGHQPPVRLDGQVAVQARCEAVLGVKRLAQHLVGSGDVGGLE
jgi:hypothetical protein